MKKGFLILILIFMFSSVVYGGEESSSDYEMEHREEAEVLCKLGLFKGSNQGFELERAGTRTEAVIVLLRLLGEEEEALEWDGELVFDDVPDWAVKYIGYAYEKGYTNGVDERTFGAYDEVTAKQFLTLVGRSLGYVDGEDGFSYDRAIDFSNGLGLISIKQRNQYRGSEYCFKRDDMVGIAYEAMNLVKADGSSQSVLSNMVLDGELPEDDAMDLGLVIRQGDSYLDGDNQTVERYDFSIPMLKALYPAAEKMVIVYTEPGQESKVKSLVDKVIEYSEFEEVLNDSDYSSGEDSGVSSMEINVSKARKTFDGLDDVSLGWVNMPQYPTWDEMTEDELFEFLRSEYVGNEMIDFGSNDSDSWWFSISDYSLYSYVVVILWNEDGQVLGVVKI